MDAHTAHVRFWKGWLITTPPPPPLNVRPYPLSVVLSTATLGAPSVSVCTAELSPFPPHTPCRNQRTPSLPCFFVLLFSRWQCAAVCCYLNASKHPENAALFIEISSAETCAWRSWHLAVLPPPPTAHHPSSFHFNITPSRVMNFTWGAGAIAASSTDFAGVLWTGRIRYACSGSLLCRTICVRNMLSLRTGAHSFTRRNMLPPPPYGF